jgi:Leucine-rich repeat (LRR) protein
MASFPDRARQERALKGVEAARRCARWRDELPALQSRLQAAWPRAQINLSMDNDGLRLDVTHSDIESLEPIKGLPLRALYCSHNRIKSLAPLRGMELVTLYCNGNPIEDLEPLRGMPLTSIWCECCRVKSLDPLRGMPLTMLVAGGNRIEDLAPLQGMPMTYLSIWGNHLTNLEPLRGMSLSMLSCNGNRIKSLKPLEDMLLVMLNCSGNQIDDLTPLRELPLKSLYCAQNLIHSLEPLRDRHLTILNCAGNPIVSLEPLQDAALDVLMCGNSNLRSLDPFVESPPTDFLFDSESLTTGELQRAHTYWCADEKKAHLVRNAEVLLRMRRGEQGKLSKLTSAFQNRRYLFIPKFLTWAAAKKFCEDLGGHLLTITSREEQEFVESLFPAGCWTWLGLTMTDAGHSWVTGEPVSFLNFVDPLQERKLGPKVFAGRWSCDDVPTAENTFVCEWES